MNALIPSPKKQIAQPLVTLVTIAFPDVDLFIPIADTTRIIPLPEVRASGHGVLGLTQLEDDPAIVIDLHHPLYGCNQPHLFMPPTVPDRYLVLLRSSRGLQYGLAAPSLPLIHQIAQDQIQPIAPNHPYPHTKVFTELASHALVAQPGFVIDVTQTITAVRRWAGSS